MYAASWLLTDRLLVPLTVVSCGHDEGISHRLRQWVTWLLALNVDGFQNRDRKNERESCSREEWRYSLFRNTLYDNFYICALKREIILCRKSPYSIVPLQAIGSPPGVMASLIRAITWSERCMSCQRLQQNCKTNSWTSSLSCDIHHWNIFN